MLEGSHAHFFRQNIMSSYSREQNNQSIDQTEAIPQIRNDRENDFVVHHTSVIAPEKNSFNSDYHLPSHLIWTKGSANGVQP